MLLSGRTDLVFIGAGAQAFLATAINMPHFMASYRLIYRSRETIMKHKWASIYIPAILLAYSAIALWETQTSRALFAILIAVSSAYLAWHYTGQVWGMMASYAYLGGVRFEAVERTLIRTGLRILLAWHVTWFLYTQLMSPDKIRPVYLLVSAGTAIAFVLGAIGIARMWRRTGKLPPLHALVAWLAIFSWYAVLARDPKALFWVQIAHAIQYLAFPFRVELNRTQTGSRSAVAHMVAYVGALLLASYLMGQVVPAGAMSVVGNMFGEEPGKAAPIIILMIINIHHYFTDGVIWKLSNPEVRQELFAHVPKPQKAPASPDAAKPPSDRTPALQAPRGGQRARR
ncbi:MAG TPA: hypothetical protein VIP11_18885 [Gemmatimonadaceae bacterium]